MHFLGKKKYEDRPETNEISAYGMGVEMRLGKWGTENEWRG